MKASRSVSSSIGRDTASAVPSKSGRSHQGSGTYGSSLAAHSPRARFSTALSTEALARRLIVTHARASSRADMTPGVYLAGGRHRRHLDRHREQRRCSGRREDGRRHHGLRGRLHRLRGQLMGLWQSAGRRHRSCLRGFCRAGHAYLRRPRSLIRGRSSDRSRRCRSWMQSGRDTTPLIDRCGSPAPPGSSWPLPARSLSLPGAVDPTNRGCGPMAAPSRRPGPTRPARTLTSP